jgi:hypothetical protein
MSWFWNWKDKKGARKFITNLKRKKLIDSFKDLDVLQPDIRQLVAHQISQLIFSQGNPQTVLETKKKSTNVGSVVDLSYRKDFVERDTIIISLSGGISPANSLESAVQYANMIVDMVLEGSSTFFSSKKIVITGHPDVIKNINKPHRVGVELKSLTHPNFLKELNRAIAVFAPCGFTTVYEALAYRVPVVFLPENHNGHVYEYLTITDGLANRKIVFPNILFTVLLSSLDYIRPMDDSMNLINIYMKEYINNASYRKSCKQKMNKIFLLLSNREKVLEKQISAILRLIPDFGGADRVAKNVVLTCYDQSK